MRASTAKKIRLAGLILFILYLIALVYFLFLSERYGRSGVQPIRYNLVPLREILRFVTNVNVLGRWAVFVNIGGNILAFCPFGAILPILSRKMRFFPKITAATALFSLCVEIMQLVTRSGVCDIDDVILNTLGGCLGYLIFYICDRIRKKYFGVVRSKNA